MLLVSTLESPFENENRWCPHRYQPRFQPWPIIAHGPRGIAFLEMSQTSIKGSNTTRKMF